MMDAIHTLINSAIEATSAAPTPAPPAVMSGSTYLELLIPVILYVVLSWTSPWRKGHAGASKTSPLMSSTGAPIPETILEDGTPTPANVSPVRDGSICVWGALGGVVQLCIWWFGTKHLQDTWSVRDEMGVDKVTFFWAGFTVLTGFWECAFVAQYRHSVELSDYLIKTRTHAWWTAYPLLSMVNPWTFSPIFYAEYGAWADREYKLLKSDPEHPDDTWSRMIESTHALFAGGLCALAFYLRSDMVLMGAMGAQLMNSVLYMGQYGIQCRDRHSVNYDCPEFPKGCLDCHRLFMWCNVFWTVCPAWAMYKLVMVHG